MQGFSGERHLVMINRVLLEKAENVIYKIGKR